MGAVISRHFRLTEKWLVAGLALISLLLHLAVITHINEFIVDEFYYLKEATAITLRGGGLSTVHPFLAKLILAAGIKMFGFNAWGWRIFPVIFGVASTVLFYLICRKLAGKRTAFLGSLLLTFENLTFVHSTIGMLDVFAIAFMLLSFLLYLHDRYVLSGVSLALGGLCKMSALLGCMVIIGHWFITRRKRSTRSMAFFLLFLCVAFFSLLPVTDFLATGQWMNPFARVSEMFFTATGKTMAQMPPGAGRDIGLSYPWEWILKPLFLPYEAPATWYWGMITPTIWVLIIPSMGYMLYEWFKNKKDIALFSLLWFGSTYLVWIPIQLVTDRAMYLYYFLPAVGAVCMAIGFGLNRGWDFATQTRDRLFGRLLRVMIVAYLIIDVALFLLFSPLLGVFVPQLVHLVAPAP